MCVWVAVYVDIKNVWILDESIYGTKILKKSIFGKVWGIFVWIVRGSKKRSEKKCKYKFKYKI